MVDISSGSYTGPTAGRVTFTEDGKDWLATKRNLQPTPKRNYERAPPRIDKAGYVGKSSAMCFNAKLVRDWVKQAKAEVSPQTGPESTPCCTECSTWR